MNKVLTNYCYSWYRTMRRTNVLLEAATADQRERAKQNRTNVLTAEATADQRERADRRASAERIV